MRYSTPILAALITASIPFAAAAQDFHGAHAPADAAAANPPGPPATGASDTAAAITAWPDERQAAFAQWPPAVQAYFWMLPASRQELFWTLADSDKAALTAMPEADREAAWQLAERAVTTELAPEREPKLAPSPAPLDEQPR